LKAQEEEVKRLISEFERKVDNSKRRRLEGNFNEIERLMVSGIFGEFEEMVSSLSR
jgi:hypothetical protein